MAKDTDDIEAQLKAAILESDLSRYRLSKLAKVSEGQLSRFVMDKDDPRHRTLTMESAARVARALGLTLKASRRKGR